MLKVLSLGAGVQSTALLLMSIRGELDRIDGAIFADTHWEPAAVHEHLKWLEDQAKYAGVPVFRVTAGDLRADALRSQVRGRKTDRVRCASMPLFVLGNDGSAGMINRQYTAEYKIRPIERKIRELLGLRRGSLAEGRRSRTVLRNFQGRDAPRADAGRAVETARYPFAFEWPMRREQVIAWLSANYPDRQVPRSACLGCPFHSDEEWRAIRANPAQWNDVVTFDHSIRCSGGLHGQVYLHRSCRPLDEVDLRPADERNGQLHLWNAERLGICGI